MQILTVLAILFYVLSAAAYFAFLFIQKDYLHRSAYAALAIGFICHTAAIVYGFAAGGQIPVGNLRETLLVAGWALAGVFLVVQYRFKLKILGIFAAPLVVLIMAVASQLPAGPSQDITIFKNFWLVAHVASIFIGEAAFALACGLGVLYLIQENTIKTKKHRFFFKRLPSLDLLDSTGYACIVAGFTLLTVGLVTGFVYARTVWGHFWSWDPKEVWSAVTWIFYAILLHERLTVGWRGRRSAIMAIIGFAVLLFTFLGVNLLLKGHHGGFTRW
jgi:cytochrome c-type biogenesis protein CcsB